MTRDRALEILRDYVLTGRPISCPDLFRRMGGYDHADGWYDTAQHRLALLGYRYRVQFDDWARIGVAGDEKTAKYAKCYEASVRKFAA